MAIVKMKRLRLMVVRSEKEELLRELARHGCVEFSEIGEQVQDSQAGSALSREGSKLMALRSQQASVGHAIALLDQYAPAKSKLLSAKPEAEDDSLLDGSRVGSALRAAESISGLDDKIKRLSAEESRQRSVIESLKPWLPLDMPLEKESTQRCAGAYGQHFCQN